MSKTTREGIQTDNQAQIAEALGPDNRWFTGEAVGHDPTPRECLWHYIRNGGAEAYRARVNAEKSPSIGDDVQG